MSKKKNQSKTNQKRAGKKPASNPKIIAAVLGIVLFLVLMNYIIPKGSDQWSIRMDGVISYPEDRGKVDINVLKIESGSNYTLETISFQSKDYTIEGLLRVPKSEKKLPAVVILPGATVP